MIIGYARVSTQEQSLDRQLDALHKYGCARLYMEKLTGMRKDRPELARMLDSLREGDTVVIAELARLGRSTLDLMELMDKFKSMGVTLVSIKEQFDTRTAAGRAMMEISITLASFERDLLRERTMEGIAAARSRGKLGGRPRVDPAKLKDALIMYDSKKYTIKEIVKRSGISSPTLFRYVRQREAQQ